MDSDLSLPEYSTLTARLHRAAQTGLICFLDEVTFGLSALVGQAALSQSYNVETCLILNSYPLADYSTCMDLMQVSLERMSDVNEQLESGQASRLKSLLLSPSVAKRLGNTDAYRRVLGSLVDRTNSPKSNTRFLDAAAVTLNSPALAEYGLPSGAELPEVLDQAFRDKLEENIRENDARLT